MKTNDYIERTFRIPIDLYHGAEKYSRDKGLSITAVINLALDDFLACSGYEVIAMDLIDPNQMNIYNVENV